ncbi:hypothetical protein HDU98_000164 [Podochytrium sp. JEL0797]|nr:hypothetical protein HDU98_000164 [Podochytrium sp. JEL0797]
MFRRPSSTAYYSDVDDGDSLSMSSMGVCDDDEGIVNSSVVGSSKGLGSGECVGLNEGEATLTAALAALDAQRSDAAVRATLIGGRKAFVGHKGTLAAATTAAAPSRLVRDTSDSGHSNARHVSLSARGATATYVGPGLRDKDSATVKADFPAPRDPLRPVFFFEATVLSRGRDGWMGLGCCAKDVKLDRLPGWDPNSFGYHGDDGFVFESTGKGRPYGPTYSTGDTIGCILNFRDNTMSFTKNGLYIGVAFRNINPDLPLYPCVGFRTPGESIHINFGASPFEFDIESHIRDQQVHLWESIRDHHLPMPPSYTVPAPRTPAASIPPSSSSRTTAASSSHHHPPPPTHSFHAVATEARQNRFSESPALLMHDLVLEHLEHAGYHDTAAVFRASVVDSDVPDGVWDLAAAQRQTAAAAAAASVLRKRNTSSVDLMQLDSVEPGVRKESSDATAAGATIEWNGSINLRKKLRSLILQGSLPSTIHLLSLHFPTLPTHHRAVHFLLHHLQFTESLLSSLHNAPPPPGGWDAHLVKLGREMCAEFGGDGGEVEAAMREVFAAVGYERGVVVRALEVVRRRGVRGGSGGGSRVGMGKGSGGGASVKRNRSGEGLVGLCGVDMTPAVADAEAMYPPDSVLQMLDPMGLRERREVVAGWVDRCVLQEMGERVESGVEVSVRQCVVVGEVLGECGGAVVGVGDLVKSLWMDCV